MRTIAPASLSLGGLFAVCGGIAARGQLVRVQLEEGCSLEQRGRIMDRGTRTSHMGDYFLLLCLLQLFLLPTPLALLPVVVPRVLVLLLQVLPDATLPLF